MIFLTSYHPLCKYSTGRTAIKTYNIAPYVDSSIRREPDLENVYPGISATCRAKKFAPRLHKDDTIVYITVKHNYDKKHTERHWMLTAILNVIHRFENHEDAAKWYQSKGLIIPSNCIVPGNPHIPIERTRMSLVEAVNADQYYQSITKEIPMYLVCESIYKELHNPILITEKMMIDIFGYCKGTENPPAITQKEFNSILKLI